MVRAGRDLPDAEHPPLTPDAQPAARGGPAEPVALVPSESERVGEQPYGRRARLVCNAGRQPEARPCTTSPAGRSERPADVGRGDQGVRTMVEMLRAGTLTVTWLPLTVADWAAALALIDVA
ncbi:hypothetical protein Aph02nite_84710 [Actinoplanes philippinensis]|nr:hypothetical protein Aph02nite_84710 [Actinoplanes philippinensis]